MAHFTTPQRRMPAIIVSAAFVLSIAGCGGGDDSAATEAEATPTPTVTATDTATPAPTETATDTPTPTPTDPATPTPTEAATAEPTPPPSMAITSPAFGDGDDIPFRYTCDGANVSPPLEFTAVPDDAAALALVLVDLDAPAGIFDHWVRFDIEPTSAVDEGAASTALVGDVGTAGTNSFGNLLYGGPCPPDGEHRYVFRLYALDAPLALPEGSSRADLEAALEGRDTESAELTGLYRRQPALEPAPGLDPTPVISRIALPYKFSPSDEPLPYTFDELPFEPGTVEAHWYVAGDRYVVVYRGIDATTAPPLCPGNSIQTGAGFADVSNAPSAEGGCAADVPAPPADVGVRECGEHLVYVTAIPTSETGNLYGTVEAFTADGSLVGITSAVPTNPTATPTIDLDSFCGPS